MSELGDKQGGIGCSTCLLGSSFARGFLGEVLGSRPRAAGCPAVPQAGLLLSRHTLSHVALSQELCLPAGLAGFLSQICGKSLEQGLGKD